MRLFFSALKEILKKNHNAEIFCPVEVLAVVQRVSGTMSVRKVPGPLKMGPGEEGGD